MTASTRQIQEAAARLKQQVAGHDNLSALITCADLARMAARRDAKSVIWAQHTAKTATAFNMVAYSTGVMQKLAKAAYTVVYDHNPYGEISSHDAARQAVNSALPDDVLNNMASNTWNPFSPSASTQVLVDHIMTQIGLPPSGLVPTVPYLPAIKKEIGPYDRRTLEKAWNIYQENISRRYRDTFGQENLPVHSSDPLAEDALTLIDGLQRPVTEEASLTAIRNLAIYSYSYTGSSVIINACLDITAYNNGRKWLACALNNPKTSMHIDAAVQNAQQYAANQPQEHPSILDWDKPALQAISNEKIFPPQILDDERKAISLVCTADEIRQAAYSIAEGPAKMAIEDVNNTMEKVEKHNRKDPLHQRHIIC